MGNPVLIGIHGVKRAGKDTVASFIAEWGAKSEPARSSLRRGFADKAKWAFARQFIPHITEADAIKWCDQLKVDDTASFDGTRAHDGATTHLYSFMPPVVFRDALAQFATEGGREIYGKDHWVNQLLPAHESARASAPGLWQPWWSNFCVAKYSPADICIIADVRFSNELSRIKLLRGIMIKVTNMDAECAAREQAQKAGKQVHASEKGLPEGDFEHVISNEGTLEELRSSVFETMEMIRTYA